MHSPILWEPVEINVASKECDFRLKSGWQNESGSQAYQQFIEYLG